MTVRQLWNRLLALGLAVLPIGVAIWTAIGWLYGAHAMLSAEITQTRSNLRRYEALLAHQTEIEAAVERTRYRARSHYWSGATEADATETLQDKLRIVIDAAGAEVLQVEALESVRNAEHPAV